MAKSRARKLADIIVGAGIDIDGNLTFDGGSTSADLTFADNDKANFGDASDLQIYHDGSNSYITDSGAGNLRISGTLLQLNDASFNKYFLGSGSIVRLYYADSEKFATDAQGVNVTGNADISGNMNLLDNGRAHFGNSNDLAIYHDASNSHITSGTGQFFLSSSNSNIWLRGGEGGILNSDGSEYLIRATSNGSVKLYYDNSIKVETTSGGVKFSGTLTADDNQSILLGTGSDLRIKHDGTNSIIADEGGGDLIFKAYDDFYFKQVTDDANILRLNTGGDATFYGHVNLADDKQLKLGDSNELVIYHTASGNSIISEAGGGSLYLDGTNIYLRKSTASGETMGAFVADGAATLYYDNSAKLATFSGGVSVTGQVNATTMHLVDGSTGLQLGNSNDTKFFHDGSNSKITHSGSGGFYIGADTLGLQTGAHNENYLTAAANGAVSLYYDNSAKLATTSTGIDVTGTVTADGLTVDAALATINAPSNNADLILTEGGTNTDARIRNSNGILEIDADLNNEFGNSSIMFAVDGTDRLKIDRSGDISFYEDTGTTAKLFWDSSAERLGLGTTTPGQKLDIRDGTITSRDATNTNYAELDRFVGLTLKGNGAGTRTVQTPNSDALTFGTNNTERMRITSSGNVGIGTNSPTGTLQLGDASSSVDIVLHGPNNTAASSTIYFGDHNTDDAPGYYGISLKHNTAANRLDIVNENQSEATSGELMSILRTSGNVGIGTTSPNAKLEIKGASSTNYLQFNNSSDSEIFRIDSNFRWGWGTTTPSAVVHITGQNPSGLIVENGTGIASTQPYVSMAANNYSSGFGTFRWEDQRASQASPSFIWEVRDGSGSVLAYDFRTGATGAAGSKLAITQSGNIGIGTASPNSRLNLKLSNRGVSDFRITDSATTNDVLRAGSQADGDGFLQLRTIGGAGPVLFDASGTSYVTGGNFGIGTNNPGSILQVQGPGAGGSVKSTIGFGTSGWGSPTAPNAALDGGVKLALFEGGTQKVQIGMDANARLWLMSAGSGAQGVDIYTGSSNTVAPTLRFRVDQGGTTNIYGNLAVSSTTSTDVAVVHASGVDTSASMGGQSPKLTVAGYTSLDGLRIAGGDTGNTIYKTGGAFGLTLADSNMITLSNSNSTARLNAGNWEVLSGGQLRAYRGGNSAYGALYMDTGENLFIYNSWGAKSIVLKRDGNVGIGTTSPSETLHIGSGQSNYIRIHNAASGDVASGLTITRGNNTGFALYDNPADDTTTFNAIGNMNFRTDNSSYRLYISDIGRVGINTNSLGADGLTVGTASNGNCELDLNNTSTNGTRWRFNSSAHGDLRVENKTDSTIPFVIEDTGNVGIGTTNPSSNGIFSVACNLASAFMGHFSNTNATGYGLGLNTVSGNSIFFYHNSANVGTITTTSTYTSYATTSDIRLKENIVNAPSASEDIDAIQVRSFDWKADGSHQKYGMVAQELVEVVPSAVTVPEEEDRMQTVDYSKLVPMLVKEVQSLRARVAELEGEK